MLQPIARGAAEQSQARGTTRAVDVGEDVAERSELVGVVWTHVALVVLRRDGQPGARLAVAHRSVSPSRLARSQLDPLVAENDDAAPLDDQHVLVEGVGVLLGDTVGMDGP
ncbi:MAG TPA: hypothetical protein VKU41_18945 [Polyangiaceae bacterium]|nr:hypothetical protein [Polyangiaceae bacterium]